MTAGSAIAARFKDLWLHQGHSKPLCSIENMPSLQVEDGYTFDALANPMIHEMFPLGFENRRLRLDRILFRPRACRQSLKERKRRREEEEKK
mgnify:CR=1 FL=1